MKYGEDAVCALLELLNKHDVPYMLVGSFSSNAYGEARSTKDADFVVQLNATQRQAIMNELPPEFVADSQVSFETITGHTREILKIPSVPFEIELFDLSDEPFDQSRFSRRVRSIMMGHTVWLPTAEDVVVQKLRWAKRGRRTKDFLDAQGVVKVRGARLDWDYINHWCEQLEIGDKLDELRSVEDG